ncbi:rhodanese-like domain-containing protein [Flavisolibacter tropicus]|uniref:Rhodanese domain-containing protein n=1 Tax=Flavisolibacter tropicus TaxID=1492898 RepID=A0A172TSF7_9BACT|nr:rhodanese-like domain-containing protein [Flavisolibacter tropicus]ANE49922.1 hypothetical protein SY85_04855 [Flavisolibacter tropicus]
MNLLLKTNPFTILDVRTPSEFAKGHVPGAINIPLEEIATRVFELRKMPKPIIAYCMNGNGSGIATSFLKKQGVAEVYNGGSLHDMLRSAQ